MSHYVVVDLEMCASNRLKKLEFHMGRELIQIGAVLLDENYEICDTFSTYVHPQFGSVDAYIKNLTGITNSTLKGAPEAKDALELFACWLPDDAVMVSWSMTDRQQIMGETKEKNIHIHEIDCLFDSWLDCQKMFSDRAGSPDKCFKLCEALYIAGIDGDTGEHDALIDAKNTAYLFAKMEKEPNTLFSTNYSIGDDTPVYNPFVQLLSLYCAS